jgi:diguanylate cyclase (GGDEF)-like protein
MATDLPVRRLLLLHQDPALARRLRALLSPATTPPHSLAHFTFLPDAMTYLQVADVDLILAGPMPADGDLLAAVRTMSAEYPDVPVLALLESPDADEIALQREGGARQCLALDDLDLPLLLQSMEFCLREARLSRELAEVTARLDWLVHMDSLTGLLNRKGMERSLMEELSRCRAAGRPLQILMVDLDDFSRINATLGHGVGDLVLVAASRRIRESVRSCDSIGRCGTDRFVIMLPEADAHAAEVIAEKIRLAIGRDVIKAGGRELKTTACIGLTAVSSTSLSIDEVLAKAHFALQNSKLNGKNRVARAAGAVDLEGVRPSLAGPDMVRALLHEPVFTACSQPIVNMQDGRIVSREMLVRGPAGPLRAPDNLFRFCQENDILPAVDLRCLKECAAAAARLGPGADYHVNIMPATLLQTSTEELVRVLTAGGGRCCVEISEQQLLGDPSVLVPRVRALQDAGLRVAIDDVGFGNSCLEGLIMLHPQVMKIDKRLVRGLALDPEMRGALVRMLKVADVLEAEVVAEGIETTDDYHMLLEMGVRFGQGYLFGRPVPCEPEGRAAEAAERAAVAVERAAEAAERTAEVAQRASGAAARVFDPGQDDEGDAPGAAAEA